MNAKKISQIKSAFFSTIPVMAGYLVLGIGFGMILQARGYGVLWALAMSVFIYAGSMQYVAIDLLSGGVSVLVAALTTLAVNARHLFYGISMIDKYKEQKTRNFLFFTLTDETYSLVCSGSLRKIIWRPSLVLWHPCFVCCFLEGISF